MSTNQSFALGQRWLSSTESELGLGTVVALENRSVNILFPATGESRVYAIQSAPLIRVTFEIGDTVTSEKGWQAEVINLTDLDGQLIYMVQRLDNQETVLLKETFIAHDFQLDHPQKRLLAGQVDDPKWFDLRRQCITHLYQHETSSLLGFVGARVDLIPPQLHIAAEVGARHAPRVLLADEVGLGKTIEAALIIHQQLLTNRAQRVLIVVPSSLVHQWLVEMLRRVNLAFSIFDEERCKAMAEEPGNPFESEQLVICSLDFLVHNATYYEQAISASWDLMVVDEAHHLTWNQGQPSSQYQVIEKLSEVTEGVLLLTATPDQLGHESHFARLRLLDPARFHDYSAFVKEEQGYSRLADAISPLFLGETLNQEGFAAIKQYMPNDSLADLAQASQADKDKLIFKLLDMHGTGRLLFRNSRSGVSGFPSRKLLDYPLAMPSQYNDLLVQDSHPPALHLSPERHASFVDSWTTFDPRVDWFISLLADLKGQKILTICAHASTAMQLSEAIRVKSGIRSSVFHEGMSIVERDKAANFFAQSEDGAQVLICSEIGSEGRNFQFAHNLVLFDLPLVPDLLEQRIGRLDRIGQAQDVCIHVPFFVGSGQQLMLDWYHQGLDAFQHTCPTGTSVFEETSEALLQNLANPTDPLAIQALIDLTAKVHAELKHKLEIGRDKLLELNSSGKGRIEAFLEEILDSEQSPRLETFMTRLFDALGVLQEETDDYCYVLKPTESMHTSLPGLEEEGMTITYERETATRLEHVHFFSWDHPMVHHAMDMVITDVMGKSAIAMSYNKAFAPGTNWLECLFVLSAKAPKKMQLDRFLPPTPIVVCVDPKGQQVDVSFGSLQAVDKKMTTQLINALQPQIERQLDFSDEIAKAVADELREKSLAEMHQQLGAEMQRLTELKQANPSIRQEEIDHLAKQMSTLDEVIQTANLHLEAVRLVVNNH
jgi:ATP-dependent helicase HepA